MKKIFNIILIFAILASYFIPLNFDVYAEGCAGYKVSVLKSDGTSTELSCHTDYSSAKTAMLNYSSDANNIAVIYNSTGNLINARYAIAKLKPGNVISLYPNTTTYTKYTSVSTSYGIDAAFIDYDPSSNRAKIRISGYTGWTSLNNLIITPLTELNADSIRILADTPLNVRTGPSTTNDPIGKVYQGNVYRFYDMVVGNLYNWYKINYNGQDGWIASDPDDPEGLWTVEIEGSNLQTYYVAYPTGNLIHYYEHQINGYVAQGFNNLGPYPSFMNESDIFYSFDSVYYYNDLTKMLDDYRNNATTNAVNGEPYYPYYLYLSTHSKTGYTANDFNQRIINEGYTKNKDLNTTYVQFNEEKQKWEFIDGVSRTNMSLLYGQGQNFVDVANTYGINALLMFGTAVNESATGTSLIAFYKNNLFGLGAIDSDPVNGAVSYNTIKDSIIDFARFTGSNDSSYSNPSRSYYFGSHYGNKGSGMNVNYATDPYWGEKAAQNAYLNDDSYGRQDYLANTLGVTKGTDTKIYRDPSTNSSVIYTLKNKNFSVEKIPVIVFDKVQTTENNQTIDWYKVYTDVALDENQDIADVDYDFNKSYGYIKASELYVKNNQPSIIASDVSIMQGGSIDLLNGVTATDQEDGDLTSKISVSGSYDINVPGVYPITYTVEDNNRLSVSKQINLTVNPAEDPIIVAENKTVSQYVPFDALAGVSANDYRDGNITSDIVIESNNVNTDVKGSYTVTYSVTNSLGNTVTKSITVEVVDNAKPIINASNRTLKVFDSYNPLEGITATDQEDGNITNSIEVTANNVNVEQSGIYQITYSVEDSVGNVTTKQITVTVEERNYIDKKGEFYFDKMEWNETTQKLDVAGYLAITGMNNTISENIRYDFILRDNITDTETVISLDRWLEGHPTRHYSDSLYNYSDTWFKGSVDLSSVEQGEYTLYIRARYENYQAINFFRNVFGKDMTRKTESNDGRGYFFRNNNYKKQYPIELFVRDNGLISTTEPPHSSNMFTSYRTLDFKNNSLNIMGTSYNVNADYGKTTNVERYLILENKETFQRYTYNIGSIVGSNIPLRLSDGKSKVRGWFDTTDKVDLTDIPVGNYIIYIRTKTGNVDDYGELNDIFLKDTSQKTIINNKEYSITLNRDLRFRLELNVKSN